MRIRGDSSQLASDLEHVKRQTTSMLDDLAGKARGLLAGLLGALSVAGLVNIGRQSIAVANEMIAAQTTLKAILDATGHSAGKTYDELVAMGEELEAVSNFSGAEITHAMAALANYGKPIANNFQRILEVSMDITTMWGGSLKGNIQGVAQALVSPGKGMDRLSRQGFKMTEEQKKLAKELENVGDIAGAQAVIWEVLSGQEGVARAVAGSHAGQIKQLGNQLEKMQEVLGRKLLPIQQMWMKINVEIKGVLLKLVGAIASVVKPILEWNEAMGNMPARILVMAAGLAVLAASVGALAAAFKVLVIATGIGAAFVAVGAVVYFVLHAFQKLYEFLKVSLTKVLEPLKAAWTTTLEKLTQAWENIKAAIVPFMSVLRPIMVAFGIILPTSLEKFINVLAKAVAAVGEFVLDASEWIRAMAENWKTVWMAVQAAGAAAMSYVVDIITNFAGIVMGIGKNIVHNFMNAWNLIRDSANLAFTTIGAIMMTMVSTTAQMAASATSIWVGMTKGIQDAIFSMVDSINAIMAANPMLSDVLGFKGIDVSGIKEFNNQVLDAVSNTAQTAADSVKNAADGAWTAVGNMANKVKGDLDGFKAPPGVDGLLDPSNRTKQKMVDAATAAANAYGDVTARKRQLEAQRRGALSPDAEREKDKQSIAAAIAAGMDAGRYSFTSFGTKLQDILTKDPKSDEAKKQTGLLEKGVEKQDELIKAVKDKTAQPGTLTE